MQRSMNRSLNPFGTVYPLKDTTGAYYFTDTEKGGVHRLFGFPVVLDDNIPAGTILFGNFRYYGVNVPSGVAVVHVEKGEIEYDGIYPAINQMFSKKHFQGLRYVNRQEDMGLEGLRKSKQSYRPVKMSKKYVVRIGPCGGERYGTV